jgi:hypothetical protein
LAAQDAFNFFFTYFATETLGDDLEVTATKAGANVASMTSLQFDAIALPAGYQAMALWPEESGALSICLIVHINRLVGDSPFILLRESGEASVYLGCLVDQSAHPKAWIEIWIQNIDRFASSWRARLESLTSAFLDRRWSERVALLRSLKPNSIIETGFETLHPAPILVDLPKCSVVQPIEPVTGRRLSLCTDEPALARAGLPSYASSLHRYLWNGPVEREPIFFGATSGAPLPQGIKPLADSFKELDPLNASSGLLMVRPLAPLGLVEFSDILNGRPWSAFRCGRHSFRVGGAYTGLEDPEAIQQRGGHLFSGRSGRAGRLLEVFHLKLNLIFQVLTEVRAAIRHQQLPFLALNAESFRVQLSEIGSGLPLFWGARVDLCESFSAIPLSVGSSESRYFIPPELPAKSIFSPQSRTLLERGLATIRIRKVLPMGQEGISIEATLATDERLSVAASDLIHVCMPLASGEVDLFGGVDESRALAIGETRFRTLPQKFPEPVRNALELAAGTPVGNVSFEILPLLSSPCDMYAIAVLATRILLVDEETTLPVALDEIQSLARQLASEYSPDSSLSERLSKIVERDRRWAASLGPRHLVLDATARELATRTIPMDLWWEVICLVLRLFPGLGPDSICRDFGDAPPSALDRIFETPIHMLEIALLRSRSLIVSDWNQNLEIHDAIYEVIAKKTLREHGGKFYHRDAEARR